MCYFNTINLSNLCPNGFRALKFIYLAFSRAHTLGAHLIRNTMEVWNFFQIAFPARISARCLVNIQT